MQSLTEVTGISGESAARQLEILDSVLGAWSDASVKDFDRHHSFTANDGSPVEFSFAVSKASAAARVLFEPLDGVASPFSSMREGWAFAQRLGQVAGIDVGRFWRVKDLFSGAGAGDSFSMLYSAELDARAEAPLFKVYLNPSLQGSAPARVVGAAMARLGMGEGWAALYRHLDRSTRGQDGPEIALFALDLGESPDARVKIYLRHAGCASAAIDQAARFAGDYQPGWFTEILYYLYGDGVARLTKPPMTCLAFTGNTIRTCSATLYCPLDPNLASDAVADTRISVVLDTVKIDPDIYRAAMRTICGSEMAGSNRLSWVSFKRPDDPVMTVYAGLDGSPRELARNVVISSSK